MRCAAGKARLAAIAVAAVAGLLAPAATAVDFSKYHTYDELTTELNALVKANPDIARLVSIGKTKEGRSIWAVEIANPAGVPVGERPALLIAANFEGSHVYGSELALYVADALVAGYKSDPAVKARIDTQAFYVLPRVNPDGAELMFAPTKAWRRTNASPLDADNDARLDEDGPEDLNKDGVITMMRVKDPKGIYIVDPADARLMRKADPQRGEAGVYSVYWEGLDNDNDGYINEDGPGGVDVNRNFQHQYAYYQPDAGPHMISEAESRAVLDYVLAHRNIAAILTFGESDNLIATRRGENSPAGTIALVDFAEQSTAEARKVGMMQAMPQGFGGRGGGGFMMGGGRQAQAPAPTGRAAMPARRASTTVSTADAEYFRAVAEKYRELTGLAAAPLVRTPAGAFYEYGYYQFGVPSFSTPGWGLPAAAPRRPTTPSAAGASGPSASESDLPQGGGQRGAGLQRPGGMPGLGGAPGEGGAGGPAVMDQRLLQWADAEKVDAFVNWAPFTHPTLGAVEIGGFKLYQVTNPPAAKIADLGAKHAKFALHLSTLFPKVKIATSEVISHGAGIYRVKAEVENTGLLPTSLAQGVAARAVKPTMVQLGVDPDDIIAGNEKTSFIQALAGSGGRESFEWLIKGKPGTAVTLKVVAQKAGADSVTLKLQ